MHNLSIFVDESGDFGEYSHHSPYYIITMLFHDQDKDIKALVQKLDSEIQSLGYEEMFNKVMPNERRALFTKLFYFVLKSDIKFKTFVFEKKQFDNTLKLEGRIAKEMSLFIRSNLEFFQTFDNEILYYDNGQHELNRILNAVLATELSHYDIRKVLPKDYKLFQAADLICTIQLLALKRKRKELSKSELLIFHNERELNKQFIKPMMKKEFV